MTSVAFTSSVLWRRLQGDCCSGSRSYLDNKIRPKSLFCHVLVNLFVKQIWQLIESVSTVRVQFSIVLHTITWFLVTVFDEVASVVSVGHWLLWLIFWLTDQCYWQQESSVIVRRQGQCWHHHLYQRETCLPQTRSTLKMLSSSAQV